MNPEKTLLPLFVIFTMAFLSLPGCSNNDTDSRANPHQKDEPIFELTMANQHPGEFPMNRVINESWGKWLERESKGRVKLTILPAETAAKAADLFDAARNGIVDIGCQMLAMTPGRFPLNEVAQLPLIFSSSRAAALTHMALYEKYPELQKEFKGVKVLGFHFNGPAQIHTLKSPIRTLADWRGQVMVGWGPYAAQIIKALGGTPEMIGPPELYDALAKKVVDGNLVEWEGQHLWHYDDQAKYSTEANLYITPFVHVMNQEKFNRLPPDIQALFVGDNIHLVHELQGYNFDKDDAKYKALINDNFIKRGAEAIYVLPEEERAKWVEAIKSVRESWVKTMAAKGYPARAILDDALRLAKEFETKPTDHCGRTLSAWGAPGYKTIEAHGAKSPQEEGKTAP
ncbi:MAG: TRAP transporter substrate-binding protein [Desulfatitalea sp.]|nr:TRAP transporter substrate-binding protein [Desulfatitalea sp.]